MANPGKHTPGPWVWNGKHGSLHKVGEAPYRFGEVVLRPTWEYDEGTDTEVGEANACLIAASPDMLNALNLVWDKVLTEYHAPDSYVRQQVEAALAKAEGRSNG